MDMPRNICKALSIKQCIIMSFTMVLMFDFLEHLMIDDLSKCFYDISVLL